MPVEHRFKDDAPELVRPAQHSRVGDAAPVVDGELHDDIAFDPALDRAAGIFREAGVEQLVAAGDEFNGRAAALLRLRLEGKQARGQGRGSHEYGRPRVAGTRDGPTTTARAAPHVSGPRI